MKISDLDKKTIYTMLYLQFKLNMITRKQLRDYMKLLLGELPNDLSFYLINEVRKLEGVKHDKR